MKDKNTIIGIVLLAILFFVFFWYTNKDQQAVMAHQRHIQDSLRIDSLSKITPQQKAATILDSLGNDSLAKVSAAGDFSKSTNIAEQTVTVENDLMKVVFTSKGGRVKSVLVKNYNSQAGGKVLLGSTASDAITYTINTGANRSASTGELNFNIAQPVKNPDGSQTVQLSLQDSSNTGIVHQYVIKPGSYLIDWNIQIAGANQLLTNGSLNFHFLEQIVNKFSENGNVVADFGRQFHHFSFDQKNWIRNISEEVYDLSGSVPFLKGTKPDSSDAPAADKACADTDSHTPERSIRDIIAAYLKETAVPTLFETLRRMKR